MDAGSKLFSLFFNYFFVLALLINFPRLVKKETGYKEEYGVKETSYKK